MSRQFEARSLLFDWQVAPAEHEIANYDEPKIRYRQSVEQMLKAFEFKSLKKKSFVSIATNVLCAEYETKGEDREPFERDSYMPLEISLVKWSMSESELPKSKRMLKSKTWMIDPGKPHIRMAGPARDHQKHHKISYDMLGPGRDDMVETDLEKIVREINSFLLPDRTVFSLSLRNCRQDLGSLKWLNRQTGCKMKPVKVFSIEDLFVVLMRRIMDSNESKFICQSIARHKMKDCINPYDPSNQCDYHKNKATKGYGDEQEECAYCAKGLSVLYANALLDEADLMMEASGRKEMYEEKKKNELRRILRLENN